MHGVGAVALWVHQVLSPSQAGTKILWAVSPLLSLPQSLTPTFWSPRHI